MTLAIAHRGHSAGHPENSLAAFEAAIAARADLIETDLRLTRDGAVVCCHDPDLSRIAGKDVAIGDLSAAEVAALRRPDGTPAALPLEAVLDLACGRIRVLLDVKVGTDAMLDAVPPLLSARGMAGSVLYGARDLAHLGGLRARAPELSVLALVAPEEISGAVAAGAGMVRLWERDLALRPVEAIRDGGAGLCVMVGGRGTDRPTGDIDSATLSEMVAGWGPEAVMLNDPSLLAGD